MNKKIKFFKVNNKEEEALTIKNNKEENGGIINPSQINMQL